MKIGLIDVDGHRFQTAILMTWRKWEGMRKEE